MSSDDGEVVLLSHAFRRFIENALERTLSLADHSVDCAVATPMTDGASAAEVTSEICRVWTALRRVLRPTGAALLVVDAQSNHAGAGSELAWRAAFALQKESWLLRNVLIGSAGPSGPASATGFFFVSQPQYFFDVDAVRARYGVNPGDVMLPGSESVVDRFVAAACPYGGFVLDLFSSEQRRRAA
jgi:hypothetical protein